MKKNKKVTKGLYKNKKTGMVYYASGECIDCTNKTDGRKMVVYHKAGMQFCRDKKEFQKKFEYIPEATRVVPISDYGEFYL